MARQSATDRLRARYRDEQAGPPYAGAVGLRCTSCGAFLHWVNPPLPAVPVACSQCSESTAGPVLTAR